MENALDEIEHRHLKLHEGVADRHTGCHRPNLSVWASIDDHGAPCAVLMLDALWGQPIRFTEMTPDEARKLAAMLEEMAWAVEVVTIESNHHTNHKRRLNQ